MCEAMFCYSHPKGEDSVKLVCPLDFQLAKPYYWKVLAALAALKTIHEQRTFKFQGASFELVWAEFDTKASLIHIITA